MSSGLDVSTDQLIGGLAELTLETADLAQLESFYAGVVGLSVLDRKPDRVWLALGERTRLGLWSPGAKEFGDRGGRHVHFALSVARDRLAALAERLRGAGVAVKGPVQHDGGDRSLYFRDPAGNLVEAWDFFRPADGSAPTVHAL